MTKHRGIRRSTTLIGVCVVVASCWAGGPLRAGDRSVTIIEGVDEPPPNPVSLPADAAPLVVPLADLKTDNSAGITMRLLPNGELRLGAKIAMLISTQRPGYLVLVDINADGRWTQIYPSMLSLSRSSGNVSRGNLIKPGPPVTIPNLGSPMARFVFQADPPRGSGAVVAILSDRPVQIIDLPEPPTTPLPLQAAVDKLAQAVSGLQIASTNGQGAAGVATWSFAAAPYRIE